MSAPSTEQIIDALRPVEDPELRRSIVDLGMVRSVRLDGGTARIEVALTVPGCPLRNEIQTRVTTAVTALAADAQAAFVKQLPALLEKEKIAYDIDGYRDAPPGLRVWCGATVEASDVAALTEWLDWAFATAKAG